MSLPAIEVSGLGKHYVIRHESRHDNLRDTLHHTARKLWRRFRWGTGFATEDFWALRDVSFSIQPGEVVGIVGRNGAGKSTLLKILSRITEPTKGRVTLRGRVASLLEVGTGFHPDLSGRENIFLNGAILGMSRVEIRKKFDEIVAFAGVERFVDTPVKHYSSGMYVRLAFSVAAHLEPDILVIDEVLAVGDAAFQKKCLGKMEEVSRQEGRTILFVSHNLHAVRQLCRSAVLLDAGKVLAQGRAGDVLESYSRGLTSSGDTFAVPAPSLDLLDRAYLTLVRVENAEGNQAPEFAVGEPWRVRVQFRVERPMESFVVAVGLLASDGTAIQSAWAPPRRVGRGDYEAVFLQSSVILAAGSYSVYVGLSEREAIFQLLEAARLQISSDQPRGYFQATAGVGIVLNSMIVDVRPL